MKSRLERVVRQTLDDRFGSDADLAAAIVAAVLDELQLKPEWRVMDDGEQIGCPPSLLAAKNVVALAELGGDTPVVDTRQATPWVRIEVDR